MRKQIILLFLFLLLSIFIIGCFEKDKNKEDNNEITFDGDTYIWSINDFMQDHYLEGNITAWEYYRTGIKMGFKTLKENDTLIIKDKIPENISYNSINQFTDIPFSLVIKDDDSGIVKRIHSILIKGDITKDFIPGTNFKITVHIKHINVTAENFMGTGDSINLDFELFYEECDKDEDYFKTFLTDPDYPFKDVLKPMSKSVIKKL